MEAGGHVPVGFWGVWVLWGGRGGEFFLILGGGVAGGVWGVGMGWRFVVWGGDVSEGAIGFSKVHMEKW